MSTQDKHTISIDMGRWKVEAYTTSNNIPSLSEFVRRFLAVQQEKEAIEQALAKYFPRVETKVVPGSMYSHTD